MKKQSWQLAGGRETTLDQLSDGDVQSVMLGGVGVVTALLKVMMDANFRPQDHKGLETGLASACAMILSINPRRYKEFMLLALDATEALTKCALEIDNMDAPPN